MLVSSSCEAWYIILNIFYQFEALSQLSVGSLGAGWWRWPLLCCGVKIWKLDNLKCSTSATAPSPGLAWSRPAPQNGAMKIMATWLLCLRVQCPAPPIIMHYSEPSSGENYFLHNKYSCRLFRFVMGEEENRMRGIIGFCYHCSGHICWHMKTFCQDERCRCS